MCYSTLMTVLYAIIFIGLVVEIAAATVYAIAELLDD